MTKDQRNLICHDSDDAGGALAGLVVIFIVAILAVMAVLTVGGLIGGFYAIKNYVISFKDNVIMDNMKRTPAETV